MRNKRRTVFLNRLKRVVTQNRECFFHNKRYCCNRILEFCNDDDLKWLMNIQMFKR